MVFDTSSVGSLSFVSLFHTWLFLYSLFLNCSVTTALYRCTVRRFDTSVYTAIPKGPPSSFSKYISLPIIQAVKLRNTPEIPHLFHSKTNLPPYGGRFSKWIFFRDPSIRKSTIRGFRRLTPPAASNGRFQGCVTLRLKEKRCCNCCTHSMPNNC